MLISRISNRIILIVHKVVITMINYLHVRIRHVRTIQLVINIINLIYLHQQWQTEKSNIHHGVPIGTEMLSLILIDYLFPLIFSRNPSDTLRFNYLDNDDTELESLIAKHRKQGTSILHQTESDLNTSKDQHTRGRSNDRSEHHGGLRRSHSFVC